MWGVCVDLFLSLSPVGFLGPVLLELLVSWDWVASLLLLDQQLVVLQTPGEGEGEGGEGEGGEKSRQKGKEG